MDLLNTKLINSNLNKNFNNQLINKFFCYHQNERPKFFKKLIIPNITNFVCFETNFCNGGDKICIRIKMLTDSDRYHDNLYSKMKIKEVPETRKTRFGSKITEVVNQRKICSDEVMYGANTKRRLQVQYQYL